MCVWVCHRVWVWVHVIMCVCVCVCCYLWDLDFPWQTWWHQGDDQFYTLVVLFPAGADSEEGEKEGEQGLSCVQISQRVAVTHDDSLMVIVRRYLRSPGFLKIADVGLTELEDHLGGLNEVEERE